jgi:DNA-binding HxlR family transcriptional regulator
VKGRKTDLSEAPCAASRALQIFGDWWSLLIVRDALMGVQRFGEFQKSIGLAKNILSTRLKKLVENGILTTAPDEDGRHKYVLTEKGQSLAGVILAIWQWGEDHCFAPGELGVTLVDRRTTKAFAKMQMRTSEGRAVDAKDLRFGFVAKPARRRSARNSRTSRPHR